MIDDYLLILTWVALGVVIGWLSFEPLAMKLEKWTGRSGLWPSIQKRTDMMQIFTHGLHREITLVFGVASKLPQKAREELFVLIPGIQKIEEEETVLYIYFNNERDRDYNQLAKVLVKLIRRYKDD